MLNHFSASRIGTYLACPRRYKYNYIDNLTPKHEATALTLGRLAHKGMEYAFGSCQKGLTIEESAHEGRSAIASMCDDEELREQARTVFDLAWVGFHPERYDVYVLDGQPLLEHEFNVPFPPRLEGYDSDVLHGFIDAVLIEKDTGNAYVVDYKFRKRFADADDNMLNLQNLIYAYAMKYQGIDVVGTMLWECKNYPMATPRINKDGTLSRAKIACTWDAYAAYAISKGLNPMEYSEEMEPKLRDVEWTRVTVDYTPDEAIHNAIHNVVCPAVTDIKEGRALYPHVNTWTCRGCDYNPLCTGELRGYDTDAWIGDDGIYERRTDDEEEAL